MSTRALAHLLLPLSLGLAACDPTDPKGGDSGGGEGAADGADGGEGADGADGDAPLASAGCTADLPWPRTIGPGGAEVEVTLRCDDPEAARGLSWTSNLGLVVSDFSDVGTTVVVTVTDGDSLSPSSDLGLTLTPSDGGDAVPVRLRAHTDVVEVPAPVLNPVELGVLDLALPLVVGWAPPTEAGGRAWASQVQGDALVVAPLLLEGGACADCTARLDWTPGASARRHLWVSGGRGLAAEGGPILLAFDGGSQALSALLYQEGGAPLPVDPPLAVADGLKELSALGTVTAVHDLAGLVPRDPADGFGLALLLTVENGRGAYFAVLVNDQVTLTAEIDGLSPADVAAGQGVVGFLADADHRDALVREVSVGSISAAEVDAPSCTVQLKVWTLGGEGLRVRRTRRLREACGGMDDAGLLHTANDPDGRPLDVVVLGGADADRLWVGAAGDTELPPVSGLPDAYLVEGAARGGPDLPDSGVMRSVTGGGNKGKVLTSDGLEYDRVGVGGGGRGPIQLTGRALEAPLQPEGEGYSFQRSQALIRKELDKSTPILYRLSPPAGVTATVPERFDDPALVPGEELVLSRLDGRLYATRPTHVDAGPMVGATVEAAAGAEALFAVVLGLNTTKKDPPTNLTAVLVTTETSSVTLGAAAVVGDEAIVFGTDVREGGPSVCTFGADAPMACAVGTGGFDQLRWFPQPDGGAVALAVRGSEGGVLRFAAGGAPLAWVEDRSWASALSGGDRPLAAVAPRSKSPRGPYAVGTNQITYLVSPAPATGSLAGGLGDAVLAVVEDESPCGWGLSLFADVSGPLLAAEAQPIGAPAAEGCADLPEPVASADLLGLGAPQPLLWSPEGGLELLLMDAGEGTWARVPLGVAVGAAAVEVSAADVDGDGLDDLFVRQAGLDRPALLLHSDGGGGLTEIDLPDGALDGIWGLVGPGPGQPQRLDAPYWAPALPELRR
ncbi:MAG: hypothetical protein RL071_794 [Pseudomonadota bacterium]